MIRWIADNIPYVLVGAAGVAMLISVLHRHCEPFREFWERHLCGLMEERTGARKDQ